MLDNIHRNPVGRMTSRSLIWLGLSVLSAFFGLFVTLISSGQVLANHASSGFRAIEKEARGGAHPSRVMMRRPIAFELNRGQTIQRF